MAAAAREMGGLELLVNMSQMTVSELNLWQMTGSRQQQLHWLCEQALVGSPCGAPATNGISAESPVLELGRRVH